MGLVTFLGRPKFDICNGDAMFHAVSEFGPDVIINAAAYTAVDQAESDEVTAFAVNAKAAGVLSEAAAAIGAPILHLSTDYMFDGTKSSPYKEEDPVAPLGVYGRSKLEGEQR
ncbi:sugar nucleotide-binding protein, partial [Arthrospira platensis SPKY1]|nr:sugar nucleotide-binding protein [Arthrospira platensis SPKY1]